MVWLLAVVVVFLTNGDVHEERLTSPIQFETREACMQRGLAAAAVLIEAPGAVGVSFVCAPAHAS